MVAVNDYSKIVEMFQKDGDTYAGREHNETIDEMMKGMRTSFLRERPGSK